MTKKSLHWVQRSFCWFCHQMAQILLLYNTEPDWKDHILFKDIPLRQPKLQTILTLIVHVNPTMITMCASSRPKRSWMYIPSCTSTYVNFHFRSEASIPTPTPAPDSVREQRRQRTRTQRCKFWLVDWNRHNMAWHDTTWHDTKWQRCKFYLVDCEIDITRHDRTLYFQ